MKSPDNIAEEVVSDFEILNKLGWIETTWKHAPKRIHEKHLREENEKPWIIGIVRIICLWMDVSRAKFHGIFEAGNEKIDWA